MDSGTHTGFTLLSRVVEISNSNIQIENRLKYICDFLQSEIGVDCICVYRKEYRGEELVPWVSSCREIGECGGLDFRIRPGEGVAGKAAQKRVPVFFADVRNLPPSLSVPRELRDFTSVLSVPVMDDVYLYGVINLSSIEERRFADDEIHVLRVVATEVAGAIRNSKLYHDARKRVSELITLNEIGRAITSTFQVREILGYVAKTTSRLLQSDGCTVRLPGETGGALKAVLDEGYGNPGLKRELRALGKLLASQIVREKRPLLINGPEDSPLFLTLSRRGITSFLGIPILYKGQTLGVISYYSCSRTVVFDMEVVHLMQTVCNQLANMIENATMFRAAQQLAQENQVKAQRFATMYHVANALMSTVKTERLLQITMHALTSPTGLNFSRAILFLLSGDGKTLSARMGMGPRDRKDARRALRPRPDAPAGDEWTTEGDAFRDLLWPDIDRFSVPVAGAEGCLVARVVREKRALRPTERCTRSSSCPSEGFCGEHPAMYAAVPLVSKGEARGAIYVDNVFREREITDEDLQILTMFATEASLAMENARLYEDLERALDTIRSTQDRLLQSEKLAALGEMAAQIAHEIKNPLTVIGGFAARIARKGSPGGGEAGTSARYAAIILKEVQRLERTIQQTLYFSRDVKPAFRKVDVNAVIRDVLAMFREELEKAGIEMKVSLSPDLPVVSADPDQVRQVLWNLISNALHAMEGGGGLAVETRPASKEEGDGAVFRIGDTGGGIAPDVVHNIFNPFFTTKPKGTGLGLPIVHAIVEKHSGTIHIDNREGEGVAFSIFLPRVPKEAGAGDRLLTQLRKGGTNGNVVKTHPG